ncbi:hypothetical protein BB561_002808 [Smittium simulii]|uniref:Uncharacterized protein n=1 Tax=Smittium simulii TaxID=133385 RepID=A0A2T9YP29_9FUNG|nr:hypothetical protein BB561_002808 [Smittium simulii]
MADNYYITDDKILHHIPFHVDYEGPANTPAYFNITKKNSECDIKSSFRGRALVGTKVNIPEDYKGVLITLPAEEANSTDMIWSELDDTELENTKYIPCSLKSKLIQDVTYWVEWGHDAAPSTQNEAISSLGWLEIAKIVSSYHV